MINISFSDRQEGYRGIIAERAVDSMQELVNYIRRNYGLNQYMGELLTACLFYCATLDTLRNQKIIFDKETGRYIIVVDPVENVIIERWLKK